MELLKLNAFPKTPAELDSITEKLRLFSEVPFVAIALDDSGFSASSAGFPFNREYLQAQLGAFHDPKAGQRRLIHLSQELTGAESPEALFHLAIFPIRRGSLFAASPRALGSKSEILLEAAAQHLADLSEIASLQEQIYFRDQFLSIASHELKTPLTSIYGILQLQERMLRPKAGTPPSLDREKQYSFFKIVIRQVERLNELIDGLLDVSRIQNGRFVVEPSETDVGPLISETVGARLSVIANEAGVALKVDVDIHRPAWIDPIRFEEVVTNLGMNAIRFSPEGGMVWIKLKELDGALVLSVRDQGPPIPEQDRARIFRPFERAQRTARLGGLGLGLFISKQIAQLHGGDVVLVESVPGKGNLFEARFPFRLETRISA